MRPVTVAVKALSLAVAAAVTFPQAMDLLFMEFGGGSLTGPIVRLSLLGCGLFVVAIAMAFVRPRIGTIVAVIAALLCMPFDAYRIMPSSLSWLSSVPTSVQSGGTFNADLPAIESFIAIAVMVSLHLLLPRSLRPEIRL